MSFLGLGGGDPTGYSGLTADQSALVGQQGWYPRPDMVLPTGQSLQQPQGYSGLSPAQAATVGGTSQFPGGQGFYSNADAAQKPSMISDLLAKLNSPQGQDMLKKLQDAMGGQPQQPQGLQSPVRPPMTMPGGGNPGAGGSLQATRLPLGDPNAALQRLQRGYY